MNTLWNMPPALPEKVRQALVGFLPIQQQILWARGLDTRGAVEEFLSAEQEEDHDPFGILGMEKAVARIREAIYANEHILVFGDYDVDGVSAVALLAETLEQLGAEVGCYIPDRRQEGYGLRDETLAKLGARGIDLVITVDCGIRDLGPAALAKSIGLDLIITDHHPPGEILPDAVAVLDTKREGDAYPFPDLAGVGLAYKLRQALCLTEPGMRVDSALDLAALGTVADMTPLLGENRRIVQRGLDVLREGNRPGIEALCLVGRINRRRISAQDIGFVLGPRLNAAGRMENAELALGLLRTKDVDEAKALALKLEKLNRERREITIEGVDRAREILGSEIGERAFLFAADRGFHEGVVGLVASRLVDEFYRPAIVGRQGAELTICSARSIEEVDIAMALGECDDLLVRYGGHPRAAGLTVRNEDVAEFSERLENVIGEMLEGEPPMPELAIDGEANFEVLTKELLDFLEQLEPTGEMNHRPILVSKNVRVRDKRAVGVGGNHLKVVLEGGGVFMDGIGFRLGDRLRNLPDRVDVAYRLEWNEFQGVRSKQLNIVDLRPANSA